VRRDFSSDICYLLFFFLIHEQSTKTKFLKARRYRYAKFLLFPLVRTDKASGRLPVPHETVSMELNDSGQVYISPYFISFRVVENHAGPDGGAAEGAGSECCC
jgi:hypothetical protein